MSQETARSLTTYCAELAKIPLLEDADVEFGLILRWKQNQDECAKNALIRSHLRFVVREARQYATNPEQLQEYVSEGNVGLLEALKRYDIHRSPRMRFLTYAYWWIRNKILAAHYNEPIAHVPAHRQKAQRRAAKRRAQDVMLSGGAPEPETPLDGAMVSLEALGDAPAEIDPSREHTNIDDQQMNARLHELIATLPPRDQTVLNLYYGMKDEPRTDLQIARFLGMSCERTRQLRVAAMRLLRERLEVPEAQRSAAY